MPQLNQLGDVAWSQLFWLLIVIGIVYFGIAKSMVPKIQSTVDAREGRISGDLAAADAARRAADATEEAYQARVAETRSEALKVTAAAKQESARAAERQVSAADAGINARIEAAEARLKAQADAAVGDIETVAADAARDMVARLAGLKVSAADAVQAVKAAARG